MTRLTAALARAATTHPVVVLVVLAAVTVGAGAAASQQRQVEDGAQGASGPAAEAADIIEERFGAAGSPVQVLLRSPGQDIRGAAALQATAAVEAAVRASPAADRLVGPAGAPPVIGFLSPALLAAQTAGRDPSQLDDAAVRQLQSQGLEMLPDQLTRQVDVLLGSGNPPEVGLVLVFVDVTGLDEDERLQLELQVAEAVSDAALPVGVDAEPFTVGVLLDSGDVGTEIGRLFGIAFLLIVALLAVVLWARPAPGERARMARRTAADVALTMLTIVSAIVWMQAIGVLLGPDYAGLIGYFSPQTQVVPVIIVGLGVDYAIHLHTRYRDALAAGDDVGEAVHRSATTVGVALLLATATTAVGFLTNLTSPFDALATLGVLASTGIAAAFVLTLTLIPAVRVLLDRRGRDRGALPLASFANREGGRLSRVAGLSSAIAHRAPWVAVAVAVLLAGAGGWGFTRLDREFSFLDFVPQDAPQLDTLETIRDRIGGGFGDRTDVLLQGDLGTVAAHNALVDALGSIGDVEGVQQAGGQPDVRSPISAVRAAARAEPAIQDRLRTLGAGDDLRLGADVTDDDVAALYRAVAEAAPEQAEEVLTSVDGSTWGRASVRTEVLQSDAGRVADDLEEVFAPVTDAGVEVTATSQDIVAAVLTDRIERSQLLSIALALAVVLVLLTAYYRGVHGRLLLGPITLVPVVLVLAWTFGTMAVVDIPLTPVTATLAGLSIGVGIDFSIHVVNRFQEEREADPAADVVDVLRTTTSQTGSALLGSALTTVLGFGVLVTSSLVPFRQLGLVTILAVGFSLLAAMLVLPSILRLTSRES